MVQGRLRQRQTGSRVRRSDRFRQQTGGTGSRVRRQQRFGGTGCACRFDPGTRSSFDPGEVLRSFLAIEAVRCILRIRNAVGETES